MQAQRQCWYFLGFELDTNQMVIRLLENKLHHTQSLVRDWLGKKACKKRDLESLLGVNSGRSQDNTLMHLLQCMFFMAAHFQMYIRATHIPGVVNSAADALSCGDLPRFLQVVREAASQPAFIPQQLVDLLVREQPDWTSPHWAQMFRDCFRQVWPPLHSVRMHQERST